MVISIKTKDEINKIRKASSILAEVKQILWDSIKEGITPKELDEIAEKEIIKRGAKSNFKGYQGFPNATCISVNDALIHGIPTNIPLKEGDIISIDIGCIWEGFHSDSAFTKGVGKISKKDEDLIKIAKDAFIIGLNSIKKGARVGDISFAIGEFIKSKGYYTPPSFTGHGIGKELHEEPNIPNIGFKKTGPLLKDGMVICIEPMILQKSHETIIKEDGWTVEPKHGGRTSHYEHTILIENGLPVVLTEGI